MKKIILSCLLLSTALQLVLNIEIFSQNPDLPPSGNFDLTRWKITLPDQTERQEQELSDGFESENEFYTDPVTGAMVFRCPNDGETGGSTYPRSELREMLRAGNTAISTTGVGLNNWVFSSSSQAVQDASGAVDGIMTATVAVDHVSTTGETSKIGRVIIGQIHASSDEPCRLYYRKLPGNSKGSIYIAHEPVTGDEQWYEMIGSRSSSASDPADGIALGEKFGYKIKVVGNTLTVSIMRAGKPDVHQIVDMSTSGYEDDWMYFKAGNYNQNNSGDEGDYAQVSFFDLDVTHETYNAPYEIPRFQPFLAGSKLQAPTSTTAATTEEIINGYSSDRFYVAEDDKIAFNQSGASMRTELRHETNWVLSEGDRSLHGRLKFVEQTCDQVTVVQIHDDANAGDGPNKPLLRIYRHLTKPPESHLWAAIKTDDGGENTTHIDLGLAPPDYFDWDVHVEDGNLIIAIDGEEKANEEVAFWTFPSYWKTGVYLQNDGEATVYFDELEEGSGGEVVSIEDDLSKDISIYPNPTDSFITIDIVNHQLLDGTLTLSDATGKVLKEFNDINKEMKLQLPEKRGLYFIIIKKEEFTKTFKVIRR
ncbi:polysaccharide lyase family 7 protein [Fulvivirga ulvae]|uniref:polysaccharide lyase family 7 protein n=1 Tax=Fulvivirga ulvae TaxID=2904245 RepID=UPI001F26E6EF|nr:polysaccharide lyase family 7 protein [Fulvivirga ulvae]UII31616.1 polysaccharide lyase family 7 protein [Fulvivirga ulvae]